MPSTASRSIATDPSSRGLSRRSLTTCTISAALALARAAHAQNAGPPTATLPPVAVTASRQSQSIADVLADITVIGPDEIARAGAQSLTEFLQRQPGVEIVQNGGPGSVSGVFLRGANRSQTLVLVDGVRLASASAGATSLEAIPLDQIERIEILRGPASSLYGADAIGGVIQVFTRKGTAGVTGNLTAGGGTYGTLGAERRGRRHQRARAIRGAGSVAAEQRIQHDREPRQSALQRRHRRLREPERVGECRRDLGARAGGYGAVSQEPPQQPVRRKPRISTTAPSRPTKSGRSRA